MVLTYFLNDFEMVIIIIITITTTTTTTTTVTIYAISQIMPIY
jgi:hypothetical protein